MNVAVIGASDKPERYSYKAVKLLTDKGHKVFPIHQRVKLIDGIPVFRSIKDVPEPVDTVTLYVAADISTVLEDEVFGKKPKRIIFNPGAENPTMAEKARARGIATINACTLVLLNTGQFSTAGY